MHCRILQRLGDFYDALNEEAAELLDDAASVPKRTTGRRSAPRPVVRGTCDLIRT